MTKRSWYQYIPHPLVMLFGMLIAAVLIGYIVPAGEFERITVEGRERVVAGSFHFIPPSPLSLMDMFVAIPAGFKIANDIIFIVLSSGIMFGFMEESGAVEHAIGTLVRKLGVKRKYLIVWIMTFVFGALGIFVGYENNIAMVPMACVLSLALGGDLMLAAGISVGAITVGFGLSPFNPYTIGTGHKIAELPLFSGAILRSVLCLTGLSFMSWYNVRYFKRLSIDPDFSLVRDVDTSGFALSKPLEQYVMSRKHSWIMIGFVFSLGIILFGVFVHHWFINQISAVFCLLAIFIAVINKHNTNEIGIIALNAVAKVAPGAFMVGMAASIKVALDQGHVSDTIAYFLSDSLTHLPLIISAAAMTITQACMNFVIPSGSGQALATLPVMIPVGEVIGMTRQTTVLAFQVGDGVSNLINPSLGGIVAMLALCRIPFDRWLRFILPLTGILMFISLLFVVISVLIHYGPF